MPWFVLRLRRLTDQDDTHNDTIIFQTLIFKNRQEAGRKLAEELKKRKFNKPYVIGLARGGVPVAYEVAKVLNAPLEVLVVRKLGVPMQPELGFGAIAPGGAITLNDELVENLNITERTINYVKTAEEVELARRMKIYGSRLKKSEVENTEVILVDDGIATGISASVAIRYLKEFNPEKVVIAAPVCSPDSLQLLAAEADDIFCLESPFNFSAVAEWYESFPQVSDEEVVTILRSETNSYS